MLDLAFIARLCGLALLASAGLAALYFGWHTARRRPVDWEEAGVWRGYEIPPLVNRTVDRRPTNKDPIACV